LRETGSQGYFTCSDETRAFRRWAYPDISNTVWNNWKWQLKARIKSLEEVSRIFDLSEHERRAIDSIGGRLPVGITPYYASLMGRDKSHEPIRMTMIPTTDEFIRTRGEADDPLNETGDSAVPGIVHRYPDRVLFLVTNFCATYCRYCTRARMVGHTGEFHGTQAQFQQGIDYIAVNPQIRDVLMSGGDPLTLSDNRLEWLLERLHAIKHLEFIRIGTKVPAVLPQRITPELVAMLRRYHPLWMSIHFMHPNEVTPEVTEACGRIADAGIPMGSQTVLTRGVNNDLGTMKQLMHQLLMARVRPYYIYQCDPISGSSHLRTPVEEGIRIIEGLRGHTSGYAVPTFVIDAPGGGGKVPVFPSTILGREGDDVLVRNYEGDVYRYPDPLPRE
jgi:lysine 2,3-aminomutase